MKKIKLFICVLLVTILSSLFSGCATIMPIPEIKEGRFDFSVTCEINGEEKTFSGVYVCEYDGVETTFLGSTLEWTGYIENEEEIDVPIQTNEEGVVFINFGFFPEYFMGDPTADYYEAPSPNLFMIYNDSTEDMLHITSEEEDILKYGVKLVSYEYDAPIENSFKEELVFSRFVPSIN